MHAGTLEAIGVARPEAVDSSGIDQDCNGADTVYCYADLDGDGYGTSVTGIDVLGLCAAPGRSMSAGDCDDSDASINPGAVEIPLDGTDQNCDGSDGAICWVDGDGDGYGEVLASEADPDGDCTDDPGQAPAGGDCDDGDASLSPSAADVPDDGVDQDCSGADSVTCWVDQDGDDWGDGTVVAADGECQDAGEATQGGDCDDSDAGAHPEAEELADDGVDQDCDGADTVTCLVDDDSDGYAGDVVDLVAEGVCDPAEHVELAGDCDDTDDSTYPGADESCDWVDSNCDGSLADDFGDLDGDDVPNCVDLDTDGDGHEGDLGDHTDCDDDDPLVFPGAPEFCDGVDNDCDEVVDGTKELSFLEWLEDNDGDGYGDPDSPHPDNPLCSDPGGYVADSGDCDDEDAERSPNADEACNGLDDDCDPGTTLDDSDLDADGDGYLACDPDGAGGGELADCNDGREDVHPGEDEGDIPAECADGLDQDCDGLVDFEEPLCIEAALGVELPPGCVSACAAEAAEHSGGLGWLLFGGVAGLLRRRRRALRPGPTSARRHVGLTALLLAPALPSAAAHAADAGVAQAERQIELAREDLAAGNFERAVAACNSALRLDPTRSEAFKLKGLALEKLGRLDQAAGMFMAYDTLRSGLPKDPEVEEAVARIASAEAEDDAGGANTAGQQELLVVAADPAQAEVAVSSLLPRRAKPEIVKLPAGQAPVGSWLLGASFETFCPVPSLTTEQVQATLAEVRTRLDQMEVELGEEALQLLRPRLGCLATPAETSALWELYFLEGVATFYSSDAESARPALERALAIRPGEAFDTTYAPGLGEVYKEAQSRILSSGWAQVIAVSAEPDQPGELWLDGSLVSAAGTPAMPGEHLLQLRGKAGTLHGGVVRLKAGDVVVAGAAPQAAAAIDQLEPAQQRTLARWTAATVGGDADRPVWLVDAGGGVATLGIPAATAAGKAGGSSSPGPQSDRNPFPVFQAGVGAGYQRVGAWDYISVAVDLSVRIVGPLRVAAFVRPSFASAGASEFDGASRTSALVPFGVGAQLRLKGPVQPTFGVFFQAAIDQDGAEAARLAPDIAAAVTTSFLPGILGAAGVDIPLGASPLAVRPQLEVGVLEESLALRGIVLLTIAP